MMFELMPELPEKVEPQPESSQTVRKFWRQRVEHSLVPRPETNHRSLRRRAASFRKRFLAHAAAGTSSFLSASTTSAPLSHSLSAQLTPIAARSCRLSTVCKSGPVLLAPAGFARHRIGTDHPSPNMSRIVSIVMNIRPGRSSRLRNPRRR